MIKHGHTCSGGRTKAYGAWICMRQRCDKPGRRLWAHYGGRGIRVCERWRSFENFLADMGEPPPGHSLDRIDNNGNYEPGNCRWATRKEQANNTSRNAFVTFNGKTQTATEWSAEVGISANTIIYRLRRHWSAERALTEPVQVRTYENRPRTNS